MIEDFFKYLLICGNSTDKAELESETLPYTFYTSPRNLRNYRVYGNTVNGESVGDKTANILPLSRTPITETHGDFLCEYDGFGSITLTTNRDNATTNGMFVIPLTNDFTIPVSVGQGGTGCWQVNNNIYGSRPGFIYLMYNDETIESWLFGEPNRVSNNYINMANKTINKIAISIDNSYTFQSITIKPALVENQTQQVPFEPYGYRIPITVNQQTNSIFLHEPLAKSGNNADYIDYKTQKRHNADGTIESVTLPEIAIYDGENEISIDTTVQPSKIYLQGHITETEVLSSRSMQSSPPILNLQLDRSEFQLNDFSENYIDELERENFVDKIPIDDLEIKAIGDDENAER